jgi:sugar/nucleoside kinase (ribokinase family)
MRRPNADEALSLLSIPHDENAITKRHVEDAAHRFLKLGVGTAPHATDGLRQGAAVIIHAAELGAYVAWREDGAAGWRKARCIGVWIDAYWTKRDAGRVVDVTGAGNAFIGGLTAGLEITKGDVVEGTCDTLGWFGG